MARNPRLIISDAPAVYHVMSRVALDNYPFEDVDKDHFVTLLRRFSKLYFTEVLGFCCMGNHFHILVRMLPEEHYSDEEVRTRFQKFYGEAEELLDGQIPSLRRKLSNLSEFMKDLKQSFSRFFNSRKKRRGTLWGERFKSVIVENGETLVNCLAYIDLNPIRAGLVKRPEDYRWNSLGYHMQTGNADGLLSFDFGIKEFGVGSQEERMERYRKYVYETGAMDSGKGAVLDEKIVKKERKKGYKITRTDRFKSRTRYFSDSGIIGTKKFVQENFKRFQKVLNMKKVRNPKKIGGFSGIYSMRRLLE